MLGPRVPVKLRTHWTHWTHWTLAAVSALALAAISWLEAARRRGRRRPHAIARPSTAARRSLEVFGVGGDGPENGPQKGRGAPRDGTKGRDVREVAGAGVVVAVLFPERGFGTERTLTKWMGSVELLMTVGGRYNQQKVARPSKRRRVAVGGRHRPPGCRRRARRSAASILRVPLSGALFGPKTVLD